MTNDLLPLLGRLTLRGPSPLLGPLTTLEWTMEVRTNEFGQIELTLHQGERAVPLSEVVHRRQGPPPFFVGTDAEATLRALAAWVNTGPATVIRVEVAPVVLHRAGPMASAALDGIDLDLAERMLGVPERFLNVTHAEIRAEITRQEMVEAEDLAADRQARVARGQAWGIPVAPPRAR